MPDGRTFLRTAHDVCDAALRPIENICALGAGLAVLTAMITVSADAIMRHLFANPLTFQYYLTENYLLVAMLLLAMPWGYRTGGFIRIGFVVEMLPPALATVIGRACLLLAAGYLAYLGWLGLLAFLKAYQRSEIEMGVIDWPVAWSLIFVPIGLFLLTLRLLVDATSRTAFSKGSQHVD